MEYKNYLLHYIDETGTHCYISKVVNNQHRTHKEELILLVNYYGNVKTIYKLNTNGYPEELVYHMGWF